MRAVLLVAVLLALTRPAVGEERVLHCSETDSTGFIWREGQTEGQRTKFEPARYIVNVLSETVREVTPTTGDTAGTRSTFNCSEGLIPEQLVCHRYGGLISMAFYKNSFVQTFLAGPPAGGSDRNIIISHGICTEF
jgi:hypothetical protein